MNKKDEHKFPLEIRPGLEYYKGAPDDAVRGLEASFIEKLQPWLKGCDIFE